MNNATVNDDGSITFTLRAWAYVEPEPTYRFVIRHTARSWFRLSRADRNRLKRGEEVRCPWCGPYRRTRKMREAIERHGRSEP